MEPTTHQEKHFMAADFVRDIVIGTADGLTVPFALAAGLAGTVASTGIVIIAGLAEIAAGSIAMGLGGYLAAKTDAEHYHNERQREFREIQEVPREEEAEVAAVFRGYGLGHEQAAPVVAAIRSDPERWVDFMMRFELGLEAPDPRRARRSATTIALAYVFGGLIPLAPYMVQKSILGGLIASALITLMALFVFGYVKARFTGLAPIRGALQTVLVGGLAAGAAFAIARIIS